MPKTSAQYYIHAEVGTSHTWSSPSKSQVLTIKSRVKSQVAVQINQASQVKSRVHPKQVKSSPDKFQVKSSHTTKINRGKFFRYIFIFAQKR